MSERALQDAVVEISRLLGWRVYHTHDSRRSEPGFPDLCMVKFGRLLFVELKTERGRVSFEQQSWLNDLGMTDAETYVWRPEDWLSGVVEDELRGKARVAA